MRSSNPDDRCIRSSAPALAGCGHRCTTLVTTGVEREEARMKADFPEQVKLIADRQRPMTDLDRVLRSGLTRRGFLGWTARGVAIAGVLPVLAACGGDDDDD